MAMYDLPENLKTRLCCHLNYLVSIKSTSAYGKVADYCEIPPPRKIRKLLESKGNNRRRKFSTSLFFSICR